jgi:hypothetical protein
LQTAFFATFDGAGVPTLTRAKRWVKRRVKRVDFTTMTCGEVISDDKRRDGYFGEYILSERNK